MYANIADSRNGLKRGPLNFILTEPLGRGWWAFCAAEEERKAFGSWVKGWPGAGMLLLEPANVLLLPLATIQLYKCKLWCCISTWCLLFYPLEDIWKETSDTRTSVLLLPGWVKLPRTAGHREVDTWSHTECVEKFIFFLVREIKIKFFLMVKLCILHFIIIAKRWPRVLQ